MLKKGTAVLLGIMDLVAVVACLLIAFVLMPGAEGAGLVPACSSILFIVGSAPLLALAVVALRLFGAIGRGEVFTTANARTLKTMGWLCGVDTLIWSVELVAYVLVAQPVRFSVAAALGIALAFSFSLAIVSTTLAAFTRTAADIKDDNDLVV